MARERERDDIYIYVCVCVYVQYMTYMHISSMIQSIKAFLRLSVLQLDKDKAMKMQRKIPMRQGGLGLPSPVCPFGSG